MKLWFRLILPLYLLLLPVLPAAAENMQIDIYGPGQNMVNIAMSRPLTSGAPASNLGPRLHDAIRANLSILPFMRLTDPKAVLGGDTLAGYQPPNVDFKRFQLAGADMLITAGWPQGDSSGNTVELRLYETYSGNFVFGNAYDRVDNSNIQDTADRFCADLMEALTGHGDFFRSTLAFTKSAGKFKSDVWIVKPSGQNLRRITNLPGKAMSPSWSMDGRLVVFTHIDERSHALGVWDSATNSIRRVRFPGNTVISPCFMPDNTVAVSLSTAGYPDIFQLNGAFRKSRALESSPAINVSPTFDATGTKMAFCSSRLGGPQVFLKSGGSVTRISKEGSYNSEPCISPDGTLIAYTRGAGGGRIFVYDLLTGQERQVSFGPGSDEHPSFAPDSYFLAFTSTRSGSRQIYLTTRHGGEARMVPTGGGEAFFPRWGKTGK
ncbi:MAG: translocation protein TolB [Desulfovibrionaceae bacterium]|nr:translocation protein TolB [Desulfovibrionaceae bacterium]